MKLKNGSQNKHNLLELLRLLQHLKREENIRDAIIGSIKNFLGFEFQIVASEFAKGVLKHNLLEIFRDANFEEIKNFIDEIQTQIQARFTDEDTLTIALAIAIAIRRIRNNHLISFDSRIIKEVLSNKLTRSLKNSINKLEDKFQLRFTESEISYLSLKFIGAKTQNIEGTKAPIVMLKFKKAADEIVQLTDELMGLPINKESEFISMLAHHLESTITKIKMGIKIENPSLEMVKREYPIAYAVAEKASKIIKERFHLEIPNEEKGYIAMYIAVSLEELRKPTKRKVVVICPMGIATSKLLYHKLANEIPEIEIVKVGSIKEFEEERFAKKIDLIISTVPLLGVKIPYVVVSPFLRTEDKKLIKEILKIEKGVFTGDIIGEDIFDERLFFPQISVNSSRQVINLLSNALIKNGFARDGLAKTVIAREKKFPTGINTEIPIAIPHAGPEFTIKKGFAIATLKNPIKFREMGNPQKSLDVRIVIMPVLTGKEEDGKEFYEVIQKLKDKQLLEKVMQSMSHPEIRKMLNTV